MPGPSDQATLVSLGEAGRTEAHRRWLVLRPHLQDGVPLSRVAAQSGIPHRTLQRWLARYRADGLAGLGRAARVDGAGPASPIRCGSWWGTAKVSPKPAMG